MPNLENAKKAIRQSDKRAERNKVVKAEIHSLRVKLRKALMSKEVEKAFEIARSVGKKLDKASGKNIFKKNTVARYKSRMMQKVNALKNG
ncbi:30S ribosomal protein S20 [Candidatus Parcubacteria bacterium]|nr:30S ribosomal protein S20 [Candidatus Parcubacteria bacterium]